MQGLSSQESEHRKLQPVMAGGGKPIRQVNTTCGCRARTAVLATGGAFGKLPVRHLVADDDLPHFRGTRADLQQLDRPKQAIDLRLPDIFSTAGIFKQTTQISHRIGW
jgi:hypothetical protein